MLGKMARRCNGPLQRRSPDGEGPVVLSPASVPSKDEKGYGVRRTAHGASRVHQAGGKWPWGLFAPGLAYAIEG